MSLISNLAQSYLKTACSRTYASLGPKLFRMCVTATGGVWDLVAVVVAVAVGGGADDDSDTTGGGGDGGEVREPLV